MASSGRGRGRKSLLESTERLFACTMYALLASRCWLTCLLTDLLFRCRPRDSSHHTRFHHKNLSRALHAPSGYCFPAKVLLDTRLRPRQTRPAKN